MNTTPKNLIRPAVAEALLDALDAELWNESGFLRIEDVEFSYSRRELGGWEIHYRGLHLGWAVQGYRSKAWHAYMTTGRAQGERIDGCTGRYDSAQSLAMAVTRRHRGAFLRGVQDRWDFWAEHGRLAS